MRVLWGLVIACCMSPDANAQTANQNRAAIPVDVVDSAFESFGDCVAKAAVAGYGTDQPGDLAARVVHGCIGETTEGKQRLSALGYSADAIAAALTELQTSWIERLSDHFANMEDQPTTLPEFGREIFLSMRACATKQAIDYKELRTGSFSILWDFIGRQCPMNDTITKVLDGKLVDDITAYRRLGGVAMRCGTLSALHNLSVVAPEPFDSEIGRCRELLSRIGASFN